LVTGKNRKKSKDKPRKGEKRKRDALPFITSVQGNHDLGVHYN